jgi:hypothetical protein
LLTATVAGKNPKDKTATMMNKAVIGLGKTIKANARNNENRTKKNASGAGEPEYS